MRVKRYPGSGTKVWLSAADTYDWANRAGESWPCSTLSDRSVFVEFDAKGDLVDLCIDRGRGDQDVDSHELDAIIEDLVGDSHPSAPEGEPVFIPTTYELLGFVAGKADAERLSVVYADARDRLAERICDAWRRHAESKERAIRDYLRGYDHGVTYHWRGHTIHHLPKDIVNGYASALGGKEEDV